MHMANNGMVAQTIKDHFIYPSRVEGLAAGTSKTDVINIQADAPFVVVKLAYFVSLAGVPLTESTLPVPYVNVAIQDSGSGRNLQSEPVPIDSLAGRGKLPFVLPVSRIFKANSSIQVTYTNFSSSTEYESVSLAFIGYKQFLYS